MRAVTTAPPAASAPTVSHGTAYALAVTSMVIWGSPPVVTRAVSEGIPPFALSFLLWFIALVLLLPFVWRKLPKEWEQLRRDGGSLVLLASTMIVGSTLSMLAVYFTTATNAVIVNASQPAVTAVFAWLLTRTRLTRAQEIGIACAFLGVVVMICRADLGALLTLDVNVGDLLMLMAVVGWSVYAVQLPRRAYVPSGDVLLFVIALTGSAILLPLGAVEAVVSGMFELRAEVAAAIFYLAIFPTLLAVYTWNLALRSIGPNRAAIFVNLIPLSGAGLAMLVLGERLFFYHLLGAAFVSTGIYFAVRHR
jgi:drug/metabolite transporter (DMT)-like permease